MMTKMKSTTATITLSFLFYVSMAQSKLPLALYSNLDTTKPLIFYISGDGGFNKFSTSFMQTLNKQGYAVIGLNAKEYFWSRKKPQEAANAIEAAVESVLNQGYRTADIMEPGCTRVGTTQMGDIICTALRAAASVSQR